MNKLLSAKLVVLAPRAILKSVLAPKSKRRKLPKKFYIALITLAVALSGVGYGYRDGLGKLLETTQPGLYHVTTVIDGDTIMVDMYGHSETVRFIGVDTPELHHPEKPVQCFADAARKFTDQMVGGKSVRLQADPLDDNRDIYGRLLRYVYLPDGTLVNEELVKQGYGFAYTHFPFVLLPKVIIDQQTAKRAQAGLWKSCQVEVDGDLYQTNPI